MFVPRLLAFGSLIGFALAQQHNPDPVVQGSTDDGWQSFPDVKDATAYPQWTVNKDIGAYLPAYQTAGLNTSEVTRAIIVIHGKERACWSDWNSLNNALYTASFSDPTITRNTTSLLGPCFLTLDDLSAGAAQPGQLLYGPTTWIDGHHNVAPDSVSGYSSFDILDSLVNYYTDKSTYPNLKVLVIAGHSAGGQTTQRYATLRVPTLTTSSPLLQFWIANPASLCWLTTSRPVPSSSCTGYDAFKYGLDSNFPAYASTDARALGRDGIIQRYHSRVISYAWGLADKASGDTGCEAETQGSTHLTRGQNFVSMLQQTGGIPNLTTIDWVPGIGHDTAGMMASDAGIDKLFRYTNDLT